MDPLSASLAFATVMQLVCCFRQERGAQKSADLADFLTYLGHHKFEEIKVQIQSSTNLQSELQNLLSEDVGAISKKLDIINDSITSLASRIGGFAGIASALGASSDTLSDDATEIIRDLERSGDLQVGFFSSFNPPMCILLPTGRQITGLDCRFLADDLSTLERLGFIQLTDHTNAGEPLYALTRNGARFAKSVAKDDGHDSSEDLGSPVLLRHGAWIPEA